MSTTQAMRLLTLPNNRPMKIFISSTAYDLHDIRDLTAHRIQQRGHTPVHHESAAFPVFLNSHSHDQCILAVAQCDLLLCVIDRRYGGRYAGELRHRFPDQRFPVRGKEIVVPSGSLSVTWCELIAAYDASIPVMTFTRQRTLDEKEVRRNNQQLKSFRPAYAEKNEVFDLLDWITKRPINNWIIPFSSIVEFDEKLQRWLDELESSIVPPASRPSTGRVGSVGIVVEGPTDAAVVKQIVSTLDGAPRVFIQSAMGKMAMLRQFRQLVENMLVTFDRVILLMDADTWADDQIRVELEQLRELRSRLPDGMADRVSFVHAIPSIEAWVLGARDADKFNEVAGKVSAQDLKRILGHIEPDWLRKMAAWDLDYGPPRSFVGGLDRFVRLLLGES